MKALSRIYVALILIFLYAPVAVMIFFHLTRAVVCGCLKASHLIGTKGLLPIPLC